jgi:hypothetical protein
MCQSKVSDTAVRPRSSVAAMARENVPAAAAVPTIRQDPALSGWRPDGHVPDARVQVYGPVPPEISAA